MKTDDSILAERIQSGDSDAFSLLFRRYYETLYQFAGRFVRDAQVAESLVQDVFVKIWSNREQWAIRSNLKSYLYTAVKNHALNHLKRDRTSGPSVEEWDLQDQANPTPEDDLIQRETVEAVHRAIAKLPEKCRRIYVMKRYDDLSYTEIAAIQGISINTVKTQMKRALKALSRHLSYLAVLLFWILVKRYIF